MTLEDRSKVVKKCVLNCDIRYVSDGRIIDINIGNPKLYWKYNNKPILMATNFILNRKIQSIKNSDARNICDSFYDYKSNSIVEEDFIIILVRKYVKCYSNNDMNDINNINDTDNFYDTILSINYRNSSISYYYSNIDLCAHNIIQQTLIKLFDIDIFPISSRFYNKTCYYVTEMVIHDNADDKTIVYNLFNSTNAIFPYYFADEEVNLIPTDIARIIVNLIIATSSGFALF